MQIKTKIVSCHTADSKPVKQEVNGTVILPPLVFPALTLKKNVFVEKVKERRRNEEGASIHEEKTIVIKLYFFVIFKQFDTLRLSIN
jgi:hypothetical protein